MKENIIEKNISENNKIILRDILEKYLLNWKLFVLSLMMALGGAFIYLRYTPLKYKAEATILIRSKENENASSPTSTFQNFGLVNNNSQFDTEIGVLKSRTLTEEVVKRLGLNKMYYSQGRINNNELYGASLPFKLNFFSEDSLFYQRDTLISIVPISQTKFNLLDARGKITGSHLFGENIESDITNFTIIPNTNAPIKVGFKINVVVKPLATITDYYRTNVHVEPMDLKSGLINISIEDPKREKAEDIIASLIDQYNKDAIIDKTLIAQNTDIFINERIDGIFKELTVLEGDTETFKTSNNLTDIDSETRLILSSNSNLEKETLDLNTQLKLVEYMQENMRKKENELIPTNLGLSNAVLNQSSKLYNETILDRNRLLQSSNSMNPVLVNLENQLDNLKLSISQSLSDLKSSLTISLNDLRNQEYKLNSKIISVPKQERELKNIQRRQQIVETLYLYLLEKREENAIASAIKAPNAQIIDRAYGNNTPVAPRKVIVLLSSLLIGILLPAMFISIRSLLNNNVQTIEEIEAKINVPILGDIPNSKKFEQLILKNDDRSILMESLRIFRTNIYFMLSKNKKASKNIFVSSTIEGEGKTSISIHLAKILALSSKKVLLIGGDIRKPTLAGLLKGKKEEGLTHYLMDPSIKPETLIERVSLLNFDLLHSGVVAPNPSELIMNGRFDELLVYANENYDYVIIDTAPVNLVTDTILLSHNRADLFIYVVRANYLDKRMLKIPKKLHETNRIDNMAIVLNGSNPNIANGYGYGHSYGYGLANKPWWELKIKKFLRMS